jgi:hypothetical protein
MNIAQQLFVVFFAIFWGTSSNAWPRWKPFHWTFVFEHTEVRCRVLLSVLLLNVLPILFFAVVLKWLGSGGPTAGPLDGRTWMREAFRGISPAFAVFGFYRLWFGIIESRPSRFYMTDDKLPKDLTLVEPTIDSLKIVHRGFRVNILFGAVYVILPLLILWILRY